MREGGRDGGGGGGEREKEREGERGENLERERERGEGGGGKVDRGENRVEERQRGETSLMLRPGQSYIGKLLDGFISRLESSVYNVDAVCGGISDVLCYETAKSGEIGCD